MVLYCSFCGKNQHQVRKLIAGPATFICDECVKLCVDIVGDEAEGHWQLPDGGNQFIVNVVFDPSLTEFEVDTFPILVKKINEAFPECTIALRRLSVHTNTATLAIEAPSDQEVSSLKREISVLAGRLRVVQQKLLLELDVKGELEQRLRRYESFIASKVVDELKERGEWPNFSRKALLFCFVDVVGFSRLSSDAKTRTAELLRNVIAMLARSQRADFLNMWGDGVAAGFEDPQLGLECACLFVRHLELYGLNVRVGVSWGIANVRANNAIGREDVDGACVDLASRLEAMAEPGEVICAEEVVHLDEIDGDVFAFAPTERVAKKAFGSVAEGDKLSVFTVALRRNAASLVDGKDEPTPRLEPGGSNDRLRHTRHQRSRTRREIL